MGAERTRSAFPKMGVPSQKEKSVLPQEVEHWSLTTPRGKLVKIGAKAGRGHEEPRRVTGLAGDDSIVGNAI